MADKMFGKTFEQSQQVVKDCCNEFSERYCCYAIPWKEGRDGLVVVHDKKFDTLTYFDLDASGMLVCSSPLAYAEDGANQQEVARDYATDMGLMPIR